MEARRRCLPQPTPRRNGEQRQSPFSRRAAPRAGALRHSSSARWLRASRSSASRSFSTILISGRYCAATPTTRRESNESHTRRCDSRSRPRRSPLGAGYSARCGESGRRRLCSRGRRRSCTRRRSCARSSCAGPRSPSPSRRSIGIPATTPFLPREEPNPLLAAYLGLGHALGLWRDAFPVADGGIVILVHRFVRAFPRPTQQPYHVFFRSDPIARDPGLLAGAGEAVAADSRAIDEYRAGRTVHPLLPFRDWQACRPALERLGAVYVAGARDAAAARQLGFVPIGGIGAALQMARGHRGQDARIGFLLAPPYFPLRVGSSET